MSLLARQILTNSDRRKRASRTNLARAGAFLADQIRANIRRKGLVKTGRLLNSVTYKVSTNQVKISAEVPYASYLERGTRKMRPHPFFHEVINRFRSTVMGLIFGSRQ